MSTATTTSDREIVITRLLDAPPELVFAAWTDPKHIGEWWGPTGFTTTIHEMDVRPGGVWRFIMHGPDGVRLPEQDRLCRSGKTRAPGLHHGADEEGAPGHFQATVTFTEQGGKTKLTLRSVFETAAERDRTIKEVGAIEGGNQTIDRLERYLAKQ